MTWLNPLAFLGLFAIAAPVIAHLFGRPRARRVLFPTLRFLEATREAPIRWSRPSDLLLLVVRCATVGVAALALARPYWPDAASTAPRRLARVIIVDTSRSMSRLTTSGDTAVAAALEAASRLVGEADAGIVVRSGRPGAELAGATAWLEARPESREIVVVSDFQSGAIDSAQAAKIPVSVALRFVRVAPDVSADSFSVGSAGAGPVRAVVVLEGDSTRVRWDAGPRPGGSAVALLSADGERAAATAAFDAARQAVPLPGAIPEGRRATIVTPGYPERGALLRQAGSLATPWQGTALARLAADPLLRHAGPARVSDDTAPSLTPLVDPATGVVLAYAGSMSLDGADRLMLFLTTEPGSAATAALVAATARSLADPVPVAEFDPTVLPDESLRAWERVAAARPAPDAGTNPGRWLWLAVLVLLGLETWLRRTRARPARPAMRHEDGRRAA